MLLSRSDGPIPRPIMALETLFLLLATDLNVFKITAVVLRTAYSSMFGRLTFQLQEPRLRS